MNLVSVLLYPIVMLLPTAGAIESDSDADAPPVIALPTDARSPHYAGGDAVPSVLAPDWPFATIMLREVEPEPGWQVHIEQRMEIRISPRGTIPISPPMFIGIPEAEGEVRYKERKIGNCLSIAGIAGVQPDRGNRLLLYMRDRRLVAADLERSCRARDFYLGFYLSRTADGQLCVDRDTLLSRSGMNCKLTRIRQLTESDR